MPTVRYFATTEQQQTQELSSFHLPTYAQPACLQLFFWSLFVLLLCTYHYYCYAVIVMQIPFIQTLNLIVFYFLFAELMSIHFTSKHKTAIFLHFLIGMQLTLGKKHTKTAILTIYKTEKGQKQGLDKLRNSITREINDCWLMEQEF